MVFLCHASCVCVFVCVHILFLRVKYAVSVFRVVDHVRVFLFWSSNDRCDISVESPLYSSGRSIVPTEAILRMTRCSLSAQLQMERLLCLKRMTVMLSKRRNGHFRD